MLHASVWFCNKIFLPLMGAFTEALGLSPVQLRCLFAHSERELGRVDAVVDVLAVVRRRVTEADAALRQPPAQRRRRALPRG